MSEILKRLADENEEQMLYRLGCAKVDGTLDVTWQMIADTMNEVWRDSSENYFSESAYRKRFKNYYDAHQMFEKQAAVEDNTVDEYTQKMRQMQKERLKLQTEKLEYNRWLREDARDELIVEHIRQAILDMEPLTVPKILPATRDTGGRAACLLLADAHYGTELHLPGLFGETLNEYSPEIFEERMWNLRDYVLEIIDKEKLSTLNIYNLGDSTDGLLRVGQLMKLRYGVIESAVRYGRFLTTWLNELTKYVSVNYQMVKDSNHDQLRLLSQPKNTFKDENVSLIIAEKVLDRLGDNSNFTFEQNPTGYVFDQLVGYNVLGIHGEQKSMAQAIKNFSSTYKTSIDILVGGHKHHKESENVGIESDVITAPSLIGIDDYSLSLNKTSDPGATLFMVEAHKGVTLEYNIKL